MSCLYRSALVCLCALLACAPAGAAPSLPPLPDPLPAVEGIAPKALAQGLAQWRAAWDRQVRSFTQGPQEGWAKKMGKGNPVQALAGPANKLEQLLRPALHRLDDTGDVEQTPPADQALWRLLKENGLWVDAADGGLFVAPSPQVFYQSVAQQATGDTGDFLRVLAGQPPRWADVSGLDYGLEEMFPWALKWEAFLVGNPRSTYATPARKHYRAVMEPLLWCDGINTPAFPDKGPMALEWRESLQKLATAHANTASGRIVRDYLAALGQNQWRLSPAIRQAALKACDGVGR